MSVPDRATDAWQRTGIPNPYRGGGDPIPSYLAAVSNVAVAALFVALGATDAEMDQLQGVPFTSDIPYSYATLVDAYRELLDQIRSAP